MSNVVQRWSAGLQPFVAVVLVCMCDAHSAVCNVHHVSAYLHVYVCTTFPVLTYMGGGTV